MNKWVYKMCHPNLIRCPWWNHWQRNIFKNLIYLYCPIEKWNAKAIVRGCRETGKELLSNSMANGTAYLSHISDLPSKVFWVQGESSQKHLFFSMTSSIGLIVTRSQKPSSCVCVCVCVCVSESLNCVRLFATPWTVACQASLSMEFSRQEYWSGLPFPSPEDPPSPGIEPWSPADSLPFELQGSPPAVWFLPYILIINIITKRLHLWAPICILMHQKNIFLQQRTYSDFTLLSE